MRRRVVASIVPISSGVIVWKVFKGFMSVVLVYCLSDVNINAKNTTCIDQNLCEDEEHRLVNLARRWQEESDECHDDASDEQDDSREVAIEIGRFLGFHSCR